MLKLAGIVRTGAKTIFIGCTVLFLDRRKKGCMASASVQMGQSLGDGRQRWAWPGLDKVTEDLLLSGSFPLGMCQPNDFVPLWQLITLLWAKTSGCSQPLLIQLYFQRALLPRSVAGKEVGCIPAKLLGNEGSFMHSPC